MVIEVAVESRSPRRFSWIWRRKCEARQGFAEQPDSRGLHFFAPCFASSACDWLQTFCARPGLERPSLLYRPQLLCASYTTDAYHYRSPDKPCPVTHSANMAATNKQGKMVSFPRPSTSAYILFAIAWRIIHRYDC